MTNDPPHPLPGAAQPGAETLESAHQAAAFWHWSVDFYARDGVAKALLGLQNKLGANVNIALWCLWCAPQRLSETDVNAATESVAHYNQNVTSALRSAREHLKHAAANLPGDAGELRESILALELTSERIEQRLILATIAIDKTDTVSSKVSPDEREDHLEFTATDNLKTYLEPLGEDGPSRTVQYLARAVVDYAASLKQPH
ncbi:MAG: TIGR02444 family protein [Pseudomonadota bacterium]